MYNLVICNIFTELCNHYSGKKSINTSSHSPSLCQPQATINLLSVSMYLPFLGGSHK